MNTSQTTNLVSTIVTFASSYFVTKGITDSNTAETIGAGLTALIMLIISHLVHGAANSTSGGSGSAAASSSPASKPVGGTVLLCLLFGCAAVLYTGCASATKTAYVTEATTDTAVSAAMTGWGNYVAVYHPPATQEQAVESAFNKYQAAELLAIDTTSAFVTNGVNTTVESNALTSASSALTDLLTLAAQFETATNQ